MPRTIKRGRKPDFLFALANENPKLTSTRNTAPKVIVKILRRNHRSLTSVEIIKKAEKAIAVHPSINISSIRQALKDLTNRKILVREKIRRERQL